MLRPYLLCFLFLSSFSYPEESIKIPAQDAKESPSTVGKAYQFFKACIYNEFRSSVLRHIYYRLYWNLSSNPGGLDPLEIKPPSFEGQVAKVVLFAHGTGGHPASFIPIASKLYEKGVYNLFSVLLSPSAEDPVPTSSLENKIEEITTLCLELGYKEVEFTLIGHSLGAIASAKMAYLSTCHDLAKISMIISLAGRLEYIPGGEFDWFCASEKEDIEKIYAAFEQNKEKIDLYTIIGTNDEIVPFASAHIQHNPEKEYTIDDWGHGGIVFAQEAIEKIGDIVSIWEQSTQDLHACNL